MYTYIYIYEADYNTHLVRKAWLLKIEINGLFKYPTVIS